MECKEMDLFDSKQNLQGGMRNEVPCRTGSEQARKVIDMLSDGYRHTVVDITQKLCIGDPRSVIRDIRKAGIEVCDSWEKAESGNRYKTYWIR